MWEKQCHKPPMTENGKTSNNKNGEVDIVLPPLYDYKYNSIVGYSYIMLYIYIYIKYHEI